jgi:hypothetical protein
MKRLAAILVILAAGLPIASATAAGMEHGAAAFERLKALEGEWSGTAGEPGGETMDATVTYHVTADGSAVMETLLPGTPHEMVTMYTLDRGAVVLTHYCAMHNQPHMRARKGGDPDELVFDFAGGANIDPKRDTFMHDAKLVFVDPDHIRGEWTGWSGGKPKGTTVFEMGRKR